MNVAFKKPAAPARSLDSIAEALLLPTGIDGVYARTAIFEKIVDDFAVVEIYPIIAPNLQCEPENVRTSFKGLRTSVLIHGPWQKALDQTVGNQIMLMGDDTSSPGGSKWA